MVLEQGFVNENGKVTHRHCRGGMIDRNVVVNKFELTLKSGCQEVQCLVAESGNTIKRDCEVCHH